MTTNKVIFSGDDVTLLYSIPQPGGDLAKIVRTFMFINRCAAPPFSGLRDCFTKALQAGILLANDGHFQIAPEWYERIHEHDGLDMNEMQSLLEFEQEFVGEEVPVVIAAQANVTEKDYEAVLKEVQW